MTPETELLHYVHKTADMGCQGIECVVSKVHNSAMKQALQDQYCEYANIREEAATLLRMRNEIPTGIGAAAKLSSIMMANGKLMRDHSPSKIAEMTIQGNNMGVTKTIRHLHDYRGQDPQVKGLTQKLLEKEESNVEQLKPFL